MTMTDRTLRRLGAACIILATPFAVAYLAAWIWGGADLRSALYGIFAPLLIGWFWTELKLTERQRDRAYERIVRCELKWGNRHD